MSDIVIRIAGDNTDFKRALLEAAGASKTFNENVAKDVKATGAETDKFWKGLDKRFAITAIATAIGINIQNIAQGVAKFIVGTSDQEQEALKRVAAAYEQVSLAIEKNIALRQNETQQLQTAEKQLKRLQDEVDNLQKKGNQKSFFAGIIERGSALDKLFGLSKGSDAEAQAELAKKTLELTQKAGEVKVKQEKVITDNLDQQAKNAGIRAAYVEQNRQEIELEAKLLSGRILPAERAQLDFLKLQTKQRENDQRIQEILEVYPEKRTIKEKETLVQLIAQRGVIDKQITQKTELIGKIADQTKAEKGVGDAIDENKKKLEEFFAIKSTGRGDTQLSDRELERKIANISAELSADAGSSLGRYQGASGGTYQGNFLSAQQQDAARRAQGELDFRDQVRRAAASRGEDAAFRQFSGLSEQRFREILQSAPGTQDVVAELKKLNGQLNKGIPTVLFGTGDG